ncbi:hypothetical protein AC1031_021040 [Aphanomyces cochlioides]|nr:hypothetical protein AC1031_021040 [Aphanomyces cochlioides]
MRLLAPLVLATSAAVFALQDTPVMLVDPVTSLNAAFNLRLLQGDHPSKAAANSANRVKKINGVRLKRVTLANNLGKKHSPTRAQRRPPVKANVAAPQSPTFPLKRSSSMSMGRYETKGRRVGGTVGKAVGGAVGGVAGGLGGGALGTVVAGPVGSKIGSKAGTEIGTAAGEAGGERAGAWVGGKVGHGIDLHAKRLKESKHTAPQSPKSPKRPTSPLKRSSSMPMGRYETKGRQVGGTVGKAVGGAVGGAAGGLAGGALGTAVAGPVGSTFGTAAGAALGSTAGAAGGERAGAWVGGKIGHAIDKSNAQQTRHHINK